MSLDNVTYRAGGEIYALFSVAWLDGGQATSYQRIGLYDSSNGFFIGYENATFSATVRTGGTDTSTGKTSFNVDTLTGGSTSKFTRAGTPEAIDLTKLNVFRIRFGWLGAAPIKYEVLSPDGAWVLFHVIRQPNNSASPSIQNADLPMTIDIAKTAGATDIRMNTACWGAGTTYDKVDSSASGTLSTASNSTVVMNVYSVDNIIIYIGTTTTGTIIFEVTADGSTWITAPNIVKFTTSGDSGVSGSVTPTSGDTYRINTVGWKSARVRTSSTLGATVVVKWNMDTHTSLVTTQTQIRQRNPTYRAFVPKQAAGASKVYFDVFNASGSNKKLRVISVIPIVSGAVAVTGTVAVDLFLTKTTSVGTGGTASVAEGTSLTAMSFTAQDVNNPALPSQITGRFAPGGGAAAGAVYSWCSVFPEETNAATYLGHTNDLARRNQMDFQPIVLAEGEGFRVVQGGVASVGTIGFDVIFELE